MRVALFISGLALVSGLAAPSASGAKADIPSLVTPDGVGGVRPGMPLPEVERHLGTALRPERFGTCTMAFFRSGKVEGYGIFWKGKLGSLWFERGARTDRGIRIGSTMGRLRRAYERVSVRRDHYVPAARNVFVRRQRSPRWRLRFDVSPAGRVSRIAFGNWTVFLVEGCA